MPHLCLLDYYSCFMLMNDLDLQLLASLHSLQHPDLNRTKIFSLWKKMLSAWSNISGSIDEAGRAACPPRVNIRAGADPLID